MKNSTVHWSYHDGRSVTKYSGGPQAISKFSEGNKFAWDRKLMEEEERRENRRRQRQKVVNCCKKGVAFLFSHVGLAGMVVAYSILGGFVFQYLEAEHEFKIRNDMHETKLKKIDMIWNLIDDVDHPVVIESFNRTNFTTEIGKILMEFQRDVYRSVKEEGWDGTDGLDGSDQQWSFAGALLFAVTVITTIGYGHVAPKTSLGRFVTIVYALIGIPLTFLYLSNIGNFLANCFRLFYKKICCDICCCQKCEREKKHKRILAKRKKLASQRNMLLAQHSQLYSNADRPRHHPPAESEEESICHSLEDVGEMSDSPELGMPRCRSAPKMCDLVAAGKTTLESPTANQRLYSTLPTQNHRRTSISLDKFPAANPSTPPGSGGNKLPFDGLRSPPPYRPLPLGVNAPPSYRQSVTSTDRLIPSENEIEASDLELRETDILDDDSIRETAIIDSDSEDDHTKVKHGIISPLSQTFSEGFFDRLGDSKETDIVDDSENEIDDEEISAAVVRSSSIKKRLSNSLSPKRADTVRNNDVLLHPPDPNECVSRSNSAKSRRSIRSVSLNESQGDHNDVTPTKDKSISNRKSRKDKSKEKNTSTRKKSPNGEIEEKPSRSLIRKKSKKESKKDTSPAAKAIKETRSKSKKKKVPTATLR